MGTFTKTNKCANAKYEVKLCKRNVLDPIVVFWLNYPADHSSKSMCLELMLCTVSNLDNYLKYYNFRIFIYAGVTYLYLTQLLFSGSIILLSCGYNLGHSRREKFADIQKSK